MKPIRVVLLCLVAALACSGVVVASASAFTEEPPEYGRCLKKTGGTGGRFKDGDCTTASVPGEEKFEWYPCFGPNANGEEELIEKPKFSVASKPETVIQLETTGEGNPGKTKSVWKCTGETAEGELTGPRTSTEKNVIFTGCETSGLKCKTTGAAEGEVRMSELDGLLGIEKKGETKAKDKIANELTPKGPEGTHFADFACGGIGVEIRGHLLGPVTANKMLLTETLKYTSSGGKQKPERFEGGEPLILETRFTNIGGAFERAGITQTLIQTNEEKIEISTVN